MFINAISNVWPAAIITVAFAQESLGERRCLLVTLKTAALNIQLRWRRPQQPQRLLQ